MDKPNFFEDDHSTGEFPPERTSPVCTERSQAAPKVEVLVAWQTFPEYSF